MTVKVDKEVLAATVVALDDLALDLPALFARASALDARVDMAGLNGAEQWAIDNARDLQARVGVLEELELATPSFGGIRMTPEQALEIAGQSMTVEDALVAVATLKPTAGAWDSTDPANLSEWFLQMQAQALDKLTTMIDSEAAETLVNAYNDVQNLYRAGGATVGAVSALVLTGGPALASWVARHKIVDPVLDALQARNRTGLANWLAGALKVADENYIRGKTQFRYPGAFVPNLTQRALLTVAPTVEKFDDWVTRMSSATKPYRIGGELRPTLLAQALQSGRGVKATQWVSQVLGSTRTGQLAQRLAAIGNGVFGRPWTVPNPAPGAVAGYGRGAGNLLTMAQQSGLRTMASSAGALRILGVAGSGIATVDGVVGLVRNWDENAQTWSEGGTEGKAHVIGEYAETAFNASMTAAMIAPNPVTLGLVAVTGVVWAGAKVVEHWDDIEAAAEKTVEWVGDRAEDAGEWVGDRLDDVKESDLNPMNWF